MKDLALILIAVFGVSAATFAQTEPIKSKRKPIPMEKGTMTKKKVEPAKKESPSKK